MLSPLGKKNWPLIHFNKIKYLFIKGCFVQSLVKIGPVVPDLEDFQKLLMYFYYYPPIGKECT